ncbi:MOSC domain-containing protein [Bradyrhizobium arachidis]|uniref:MOSC domain-containing protein n=1 Tax=Bradyrhizobium arachidis TaxID=858423 RepID=UPI001FCD667D|nr:MOSC domain-containing protein [Bradyrhizobium arachidis]
MAVAADRGHHFSKPRQDQIVLVEGHGVEGDAHARAFVRHRYLARREPRLPNLRQVHLIRSELFAPLSVGGLKVGPKGLGENITTAGLDLERSPLGILIKVGPAAIIELTGLRTPCILIERFQAGLKRQVASSEGTALHSNAECLAWCGPAELLGPVIPRGFGSRSPFVITGPLGLVAQLFARRP